jgi:hypothetical protein
MTASVVYWFACLPLAPEFAGSNPVEAVESFLCKKSSACLPLEGKLNNLSHVPTLRHVKEPSNCGKLRVASQIPSIKVPSFVSRGLSRRLVRWRLWRWRRELRQGWGTINSKKLQCRKTPPSDLLTFKVRHPRCVVNNNKIYGICIRQTQLCFVSMLSIY